VGMGALVGAATFVGMLACGFPALLVPLFLGFAMHLVALHALTPVEAARTNVAHVREHLQEHVVLAVVIVVLSSVATMIPLLGLAFVLALTTRAYRTLFGDGAAPQLLLTDASAT